MKIFIKSTAFGQQYFTNDLNVIKIEFRIECFEICAFLEFSKLFAVYGEVYGGARSGKFLLLAKKAPVRLDRYIHFCTERG